MSSKLLLLIFVFAMFAATFDFELNSNFYYRVFHRFGHAKFPDDGSIIDSSQFSILPQLPPKMLLDSKVVISLC